MRFAFADTFMLLALAGLAGCGGGSVPEKPAVTAKPAGPAISQLNVYLDASTGMRGFMHANAPGSLGSTFQRSISEVLSNVNGLASAGKSYYFVQESTPKDPRVLRPGSYGELSSTVSTGIKNPALGTELPAMLREVLHQQQAKAGTVSLIISDFIYAPPDLTQTWRVKTDVKEALGTVPANKLALRIYAGTSEFRDKFFPGNRTRPQLLSGARLPFYVWVLGAPAAVAAAAPLLQPLLGPGFEQVGYNLPAPPATVYEHFGNAGVWYLQKSGGRPVQPLTLVFSQAPTQAAPAEFAVGLDLHAAPAAEAATLPQQLRLNAGGAEATLLRVQALSALPRPPASAALPTATHVARVRLARLPAGPQTMQLALPRTVPAWVAQYSTTNDSNIARQGPKTFLLSEVLQGVQDYYAPTPAGQQVWAVPVVARAAE